MSNQDAVIGAIAGDIIGSAYESPANRIKTKDFPLFSEKSRFTDDTVLTLAVADWILGDKLDTLPQLLRAYAKNYPVGYGPQFWAWVTSDGGPYGSFGNGSAMRASPCGAIVGSVDIAEDIGGLSALPTHNHPEGIKGAKATAAAVQMAGSGKSKREISNYLGKFYSLAIGTIADIRPAYRFDPTCQGTVPQAILCFLESTSYEDAVRLAVSLGGDSDTLACIAGGIAGAFYGVPDEIQMPARLALPPELAAVLNRFEEAISNR
jgi:ADP-ribosylglycohydrolase